MAAYTVKLPDVGEGIAQAEIVAWHVVVGDPIHEDQVIAEIMTDKATVELPSPIDGVITWLGGEVGDILSVGADLLRIETKSAATPAYTTASEPDDGLFVGGASDGVASDRVSGDVSGDRVSGDVVSDGVSDGGISDDRLSDDLAPVGADMIDLNAPPVGEHTAAAELSSITVFPREVIAAIDRQPFASDSLGSDIALVTVGAIAKPEPRSLVGQPVRALAAPAVRDRARRMAIDLESLTGSGPGGRVTHQDLDEAITKPRGPVPPSSARLAVGETRADREAHPVDAVHPAGEARSGGEDVAPEIERIKIIGLRRNIAERMQLSKRRIPHFTYVEEVDVTELERLRQQLNSSLGNRTAGFPDGQGVGAVSGPSNDDLSGRIKLTLLPFIMRAVVKALALHPQMNARFDDDAGVLERYSEVRLGIAVQTVKGLMVPVVKGMRTLDLWESAAEVTRLSELARTSKIKIEDLIGSTITITSLGPLGGIASTPVINYPEVAVIGVNKIVERPVYVERKLVPRKIMNLSSSFDHRVVDGADAAAFIQAIRSLLETPALLFV